MSEPHEKSFTSFDAKRGGLADEPEMKHEDDMLDEALKETFPASDPIAVEFTRIVLEMERRRG